MKISITGNLNRKLASLYYNVTSSIAFYPVIITFCYLVLVVFMLWFDYSEPAAELSREMPWLQFKEMSAVRAILTTLIAGIISLMALSFSMVMVVWNQATSSVSPKVMQGLITKKEHQFVLGNQFGAILYFMVVLLLLRGIDYYKIPVFSVGLGLILGFWSLGLFVYFIHSISQSIQVTNIIASIHRKTSKVLQELTAEDQKAEILFNSEGQESKTYPTDQPGFLQEVNQKKLLKLAEKCAVKIEILPRLTEYVPTGCALFSIHGQNQNLEKDEIQEIFNAIVFHDGENIQANYVYGFTQLGEIAVKSLSPGINDSGIAVLCIQLLSDLFLKSYQLSLPEIIPTENRKGGLVIKQISFPELFTRTISPIRQYGRHDLSVLRALLQLLLVLGLKDQVKQKFKKQLNEQAQTLLTGLQELNLPETDLDLFNATIRKMQLVGSGYFMLSVIRPNS